jgi:hypothetical protein
MILEILEWCLTPASLRARTSGLLGEQIAIRHRALRCRGPWESHLQASKAFLARNLPQGGHVAVLGSGHLRDIDLGYLKKRFQRITLVDVVHPFDVRLRALCSGNKVKLFSGDLSGALHLENPNGPIAVEKQLDQLLRSVDTLVSSCVLTQLALPLLKRWEGHFTEHEIDLCVNRIRKSHLSLLKASSCGILVTDTARRYGQDAWTPLLTDLDLPMPSERWIWDIAPPFEHGMNDRGSEQRQVDGFVFNP